MQQWHTKSEMVMGTRQTASVLKGFVGKVHVHVPVYTGAAYACAAYACVGVCLSNLAQAGRLSVIDQCMHVLMLQHVQLYSMLYNCVSHNPS